MPTRSSKLIGRSVSPRGVGRAVPDPPRGEQLRVVAYERPRLVDLKPLLRFLGSSSVFGLGLFGRDLTASLAYAFTLLLDALLDALLETFRTRPSACLFKENLRSSHGESLQYDDHTGRRRDNCRYPLCGYYDDLPKAP